MYDGVQQLVSRLNCRLKGIVSKFYIIFLKLSVYKIDIGGMQSSMLVRPDLKRGYMKYNNNAGGVSQCQVFRTFWKVTWRDHQGRGERFRKIV